MTEPVVKKRVLSVGMKQNRRVQPNGISACQEVLT